MKKTILLVLVSLILVACNLPFTINWKTATDTPVSPTSEVVVPDVPTVAPSVEVPTVPVFVGQQMNLGGISMVVPPCLAVNPAGEIVAAQPYDENSGPMEYFPQHRKISFPGYPLADKFFYPVLRVYPVADFVAMNAYIGERVNALITLLNTQPASPVGAIPFLPMYNAAEVFRSQVQYLNFQNGQGVRFLTEFSQYYAPVNNQDLFYTYQGLTSDGKYWVSIIFPVNAAFLQDNPSSTTAPAGGVLAPQPMSPNYENDFLAYYANMTATLDGTPDNAFTPALDCLDAFVSSLQIGD
jgi:hypothetical protein